MEKNKFALKCFEGKINHFKTIFFKMENGVIEDPYPASLMENSINFFLNCPLLTFHIIRISLDLFSDI